MKQKHGLPSKVKLAIGPSVDVESDGADVLSDRFGFCVNGFNFEVVEKDGKHQVVKFYDINWDTDE